jgi:hypothetical protein
MSQRISVGRGRARRRSDSGRQPGIPGLGWLPVPFAILAAAGGRQVFGSLRGRRAATAAAEAPGKGAKSFRLAGQGGENWPAVNDGSALARTAVLQPNCNVDITVYFDALTQNNKDLSIEWLRGSAKWNSRSIGAVLLHRTFIRQASTRQIRQLVRNPNAPAGHLLGAPACQQRDQVPITR